MNVILWTIFYDENEPNYVNYDGFYFAEQIDYTVYNMPRIQQN